MRKFLAVLCLLCVGTCYASDENPLPTDLLVYVSQPTVAASTAEPGECACQNCACGQKSAAAKPMADAKPMTAQSAAAGSCAVGSSCSSAVGTKIVGSSSGEPRVRRSLFGRSGRVRGFSAGSCSSGGCQ